MKCHVSMVHCVQFRSLLPSMYRKGNENTSSFWDN